MRSFDLQAKWIVPVAVTAAIIAGLMVWKKRSLGCLADLDDPCLDATNIHACADYCRVKGYDSGTCYYNKCRCSSASMTADDILVRQRYLQELMTLQFGQAA